MIVEYNNQYEEEVKDLFVELQEYIASIDKEKYSIITEGYREKYFKKTIEEVKKCNGKIVLFSENNKIVGLVVGLINNVETFEYDLKVPKRGRITELIVSNNYRKKGYGKKLLNYMEQYLNDNGCEDILLGVFGYNENAIQFYEQNDYHMRTIDMTKKIS